MIVPVSLEYGGAVVEGDRRRWDERYANREPPSVGVVEPPDVIADYAEVFPTRGRALDLACGQGRGAVWLALRGMDVVGVDISPVAISHARDLAQRSGVGDRCRFDVVDLDNGLPAGPPVDAILCHKFRDRRLDRAIMGTWRRPDCGPSPCSAKSVLPQGLSARWPASCRRRSPD